MSINTKKVQGRRQVRYDSFDEMLADARRLSGSEVRRLGNWSPGQIHEHLAKTMNATFDGFDFMMPAPVRWLMSALMKKKFVHKSIPAGFKSTAKFLPEETSTEAGLAALEEAVERQKSDAPRVMHPGFGNLSVEEWDGFHLRHAEMHMSFLQPSE